MGATRMTRQTALRRGAKRYRGRACRHCGNRVRYTSNAACVDCLAAMVETRESNTARKRRYRARLAIADHEYRRLLAIRDAMPADAPTLQVDLLELPLTLIRPAMPPLPRMMKRRRPVSRIAPAAALFSALLGLKYQL